MDMIRNMTGGYFQATLPQGSLIQLGSDLYYARARVEARLLSVVPIPSPIRPIPAAVIHNREDKLSLQDIQETFARFLRSDDVFQEDFTHHGYLIIQQQPQTATFDAEVTENPAIDIYSENFNLGPIPNDLADYLKHRSLVLCFATIRPILPEGPYFAIESELHQAWRVYQDHLGAFSNSVMPNDFEYDEDHPKVSDETWKFVSLQASSFTGSDTAVAVPSRLYFKKDDEKPLNGKRVSIKDNIHLKGVVTSLGNRAYAEFYGEQSASAKYIKSLISKGAIVVGKTKLSAFAGSEVPPIECIDYFPPWNARGDGYQGPSGSSSGAAASVGGYDWLDFAICTDTTGSMRHPAASHGVWGHRLTWNRLSMEGVVPACASYDTFGLLARSPQDIQAILSASGLTARPQDRPTRILYPVDWYPLADANQQRMNEAFLEILEDSIGVKHTEISIAEEWSKTAPESLREKSLADYLKTTGGVLNGYDNLHNFDKFRSEYREQFKKQAYVSPAQTARWDKNSKWTVAQRETALRQLEVFKKWIWDKVFSVDDVGGCQTVMIVPHGRAGANYRDTVAEGGNKGIPAGVTGPVFMVSMMGAPQIVIPIGQNSYSSRVSQQTEFAPIVTTLVGSPNTDSTLLAVVQDALKNAKWPTNVLTGRYMFDVGENERNSDPPKKIEKLQS